MTTPHAPDNKPTDTPMPINRPLALLMAAAALYTSKKESRLFMSPNIGNCVRNSILIKVVVAACLLGAMTQVSAAQDGDWSYRGARENAIYFVAAGTVMTAVLREPRAGFLSCAGIATTLEVLDKTTIDHRWDMPDFVWSMVGCALGVGWHGWMVKLNAGRPQVTYAWEFK